MTDEASAPKDDLAERHDALVRRRAMNATWAVVWAIGSAELLFASFAIGSSLGPMPLRPSEVLIGSTAFFLAGVGASFWLTKRKQESGAVYRARVLEGRKEHRVFVYDGYLTIGPEIVLRDAITSVELDDRGLVLRYRDPRFEGAVLRELEGSRAVLEELERRLARAPAGTLEKAGA